MLKAMLEMKGFKVDVKLDTNGIKEFLEEINPNAVLMDMLLAGADGREICADIKADNRFDHIKIVMISAHPDAHAECLRAGADYFVAKPFEMSQLITVVSSACQPSA